MFQPTVQILNLHVATSYIRRSNVILRFIFKGVQEGKIPVVRTTALATPITHVLVPGHTLGTPGSVQMAKIAPATTALPTQQTTVIPASTVNAGVPGVQQAATISKTILPQASLQQLQSHNVVINPGNLHQIQRPVAETGEGMASSKIDLFINYEKTALQIFFFTL